LVRVLRPSRKSGALYLPDQHDIPDREGVVMKVGPECDGLVAKGDRVLLSLSRAATITINDQEYRLVKESEILAILEEECHE
jgi:co-chaperonin GroES (HSP10)